MTNDTELRIKGLKVLLDALGEVEAEKFISLMIKEPFDYTFWQKDLLVDKDVEDLSKKAMEYRRHNK